MKKDPEAMSESELEMLLEIKKLEMKLAAQNLESKLRIPERILRYARTSGLLDKLLAISRPSPESSQPDPSQQ